MPSLSRRHPFFFRNDLYSVFNKTVKTKNKMEETSINVGINVNEAAGQSIFHVHIHLIPRYKGDVENPKGGVRGVIPERQGY